MKDYSGTPVIPNRVILPVVDQFPHQPLVGEILFFNQVPREGVYIFDGSGWKAMFSTENNLWTSFYSEKDKYVYELEETFNNDGKSIVIYMNGERLPKNAFAEVSNNEIAWKGDELPDGVFFEIQIFNRRTHSAFDVKSFNRRNGIC